MLTVQFVGSFIPPMTSVPLWHSVAQQDAMTRLSAVANVIGLQGPPTWLGDSLAIIRPAKYAEAFLATDSVRWDTRLPPAGIDANVQLPTADSASNAAKSHLRALGWSQDALQKLDITHERHIPPDGSTTGHATALHVNFRYVLDGVRVGGPGAKARVTIDQHGIRGAYRFWRPVSQGQAVSLIPMSTAMNIVAQDSCYAHLSPDTSSVVFRQVELNHFAFPPFVLQSHLVPLYTFYGTVSSPTHGSHDIVKHVLAVSRLDATAHGLDVGLAFFDKMFLH